MKVVEIINEADPAEVVAEYIRVYGKEDGWAEEESFRRFRHIVNDAIGVQGTMRALVRREREEEDGDEWFDVSGADDRQTNWAIEFRPWGQWKLMEVEAPGDLSISQIACHLYYEMAWAGWPEEIEKRWAEIEDSAEKVMRDMDKVDRGEATMEELGYVELGKGKD